MIDVLAETDRILAAASADGWVLEPEAKRLFSLWGFSVPRFHLARTLDEALQFAAEIGYPVIAKVVSPRVLHKSDVGGVAAGVADEGQLHEAYRRFEALEGFVGTLVEERVRGIELILGAKRDVQFGPMVLLGIGGTGVEIYRDFSLRMAPLSEGDAAAMIAGLKGYPLLTGYRGAEPVDLGRLTETLLRFSALVKDLGERISSIDVNPLFCSPSDCIVADARIILAG
jgi:acyl-CoA synthetase (NDP forming)